MGALAAGVRSDGLEHVVLLGMGGSSLAPDVFANTFGSAPGHPALTVLDSTHPEAVLAVERRIDMEKTLFVVSSKSGTTLETLSLFRTFWERAMRASNTPGRHFVAITDPGTPLEQLANERGFRRVFRAPSDVGGRYSALSVFGLVPAALIGVDVHRLLDRAWTMAEASSFCVAEGNNPSLTLGAALGELAAQDRDKVTFLTSPSLAAFPAWIEQLIAESTGKDAKGILPVDAEPARALDGYAADRVFVGILLEGDENGSLESRLVDLGKRGHPVITIRLREKADLGQEMFRWELAVAAAGAVLEIHPFNQPDVQVAKELARKAMEGDGSAAAGGTADAVSASEEAALRQALSGWANARPGDYVAVQAYLAPTDETTATLQSIRAALGRSLGVATTLGYGPRFLHSTGQLHKGGPNTGLFLQLVDEPAEQLPVPETDYTFGALIAAQALGDYRALSQRERRVLRVNLGRDVRAGLRQLAAAL
jgi:transaldolase/glucose-6-phosphate isomerase